MSAQSFALRTVAAMLLIGAIACDDGSASGPPVDPPPAAVASVQLDVSELTLVEGAWRHLHAMPRDAAGRPLPDRDIFWTSSDQSVASVTADGTIAAIAAGVATIRATSEGKSGFATVVVTQPPVAAVELDAPTTYLAANDAIQLTARARGEGNVVLNRPITWSTSDAAIATVDATGKVTGRAPGAVTITAAAGDKSRSVSLTVVQWSIRSLVSVNGGSLPTVLFTRPVPQPDGSVRPLRVDAHHGQLRMSLGRWEHAIGVWLHPEGSVGEHATYGFSGTYEYDVFTDEIVFYSIFGIESFRGRHLADGSIEFSQLVESGAPRVRFVYGPQ